MCKTGHSPERLLAVFDYTDKRLANSIIAGKYKFIKDVFLVLGQAIAEKLAMELEMLNREQVLITPLPLHPRRKRWRGFNQSELLAQKLSEMFELPVIEALLRTRYTKTQKDLDKLARQKNIKGCFSINPKTNVTGKTVLLIDDVATTGSTLFGAATTLKKGGAQVVWCIALAQD
jgi:ComF family protein